MAHNNRIRLTGFWTAGSVVLPAELEALDQAQYEEINGDQGGTWAPANQIILGGQGLRVTGPSRLDDAQVTITGGKNLTLLPGATLVQDPFAFATLGGLTTLTGEMLTSGTGSFQVATVGGIQVPNGGEIDVYPGGAWRLKQGTNFLTAPGGAGNVDAGAVINFTGTSLNPSGLLTSNSTWLFGSGTTVAWGSGATASFASTATFTPSSTISLQGTMVSTTASFSLMHGIWDFDGFLGMPAAVSFGQYSTVGVIAGSAWTDAGAHTNTGAWAFVGAGVSFDVASTVNIGALAHLTFPQPAANANVGANALLSTLMPKCYGKLVTDGSGGVALKTATSGTNISSVLIPGGASGQQVLVNFVTDMADDDYIVFAVFATPNFALTTNPTVFSFGWGCAATTSSVELLFTQGQPADNNVSHVTSMGATVGEIYFFIMGRQ